MSQHTCSNQHPCSLITMVRMLLCNPVLPPDKQTQIPSEGDIVAEIRRQDARCRLPVPHVYDRGSVLNATHPTKSGIKKKVFFLHVRAKCWNSSRFHQRGAHIGWSNRALPRGPPGLVGRTQSWTPLMRRVLSYLIVSRLTR